MLVKLCFSSLNPSSYTFNILLGCEILPLLGKVRKQYFFGEQQQQYKAYV